LLLDLWRVVEAAFWILADGGIKLRYSVARPPVFGESIVQLAEGDHAESQKFVEANEYDHRNQDPSANLTLRSRARLDS